MIDVKKYEVLKALDEITEMSDEEMAINQEWIRKVANSAYSLVKQKYKPNVELRKK